MAKGPKEGTCGSCGCSDETAQCKNCRTGPAKPKQPTRLKKAECPNCGMVLRVTRSWVTLFGAPFCGCAKSAQFKDAPPPVGGLWQFELEPEPGAELDQKAGALVRLVGRKKTPPDLQ